MFLPKAQFPRDFYKMKINAIYWSIIKQKGIRWWRIQQENNNNNNNNNNKTSCLIKPGLHACSTLVQN